MARKLRVEYPDAIYHIMSRGDRREPIFIDVTDHRRFLETLADTCVKTSWQVHAYCLMPNHFHLVVETPQANLVAGMKWFLGTYTTRFNRRHGFSGHLFGGRYKSLIIDGANHGYLKTACDYVHLNPVRARLISKDKPLREYPWSSYPVYLKIPRQRPEWLRVDRLLGEWGIVPEGAAGRRRFEQGMEARRGQEETALWTSIRKGWYFGGESLRDKILKMMEYSMGTHHSGKEKHETAVAKAESLVVEELGKRRWTEADLRNRPKTETNKVAIARRLRTETVMTLDWIAQRLSMGCRHTLAHELKAHRLTNSRD